MRATCNRDQIEIGDGGFGSFAFEEQPISAKGMCELSAHKGVSNCAETHTRIEIAGAIEAKQPRDDPVPSDLGAAAHSGRVVVCGAMGKAERIFRVLSNASPPITAEVEHLHQHHLRAP